MIYMLVVWPKAMPQISCIKTWLSAFNATVLYGIRIHPDASALEDFIQGIYSRSQYDLDRIQEKKEVILSQLTAEGIVAVFFSRKLGYMEWNEERGRLVDPGILVLKDRIREEMQANMDHTSFYETIHMTDDLNEFENDTSYLMRMICVSKSEYISDINTCV